MTVTVIRDDFEVCTAKGAPIKRFDNQLRAAWFAKANETTFPGITVIRVTITQEEERKVAYRPRPKAEDFDIPAIPERKIA